MIYEVKISTRGTFTIPAAIRKGLGIRPGQKVSQRREGNTIVIKLVNGSETTDSSEGKSKK